MRKKSGKRGNLLPVYELIYVLAAYFDYTCEVCNKKMRKPMSGFTIHHTRYRDNEKSHKDFTSRLKYYEYLTIILLKWNRKRLLHNYFAFVCNACHHSIDGPRGLGRRKRINVLRLFNLWYRTNT